LCFNPIKFSFIIPSYTTIKIEKDLFPARKAQSGGFCLPVNALEKNDPAYLSFYYAENLRPRIEDKADLTNARLEQLSKGPQISYPAIIDKDIKISYINNSSFSGLTSLYRAILSFQK
jgi:hypothetical protein